MRTASESLSAVLCACTVRMPSSRAARMMRTAISPRLAMRSFFIGMRGLSLHVGQRLAGHDGVFVLGVELHDLAGESRLHLVEGFHHLDQADHVTHGNRVALVLVDRL